MDEELKTLLDGLPAGVWDGSDTLVLPGSALVAELRAIQFEPDGGLPLTYEPDGSGVRVALPGVDVERLWLVLGWWMELRTA